MTRLLIVDDEPNVRYSLARGLSRDRIEVIAAETGREGLQLIAETQPDVAIFDVRLPDMSGLDAFEEVCRIDPRLPVIIITADSATETAIEATKRGAFDYLPKPVDLGELRRVVARACELRRMRAVPAVFDQPDSPPEADRIIGQSRAMQEVYKAIGRVAPHDDTVLILGESGTGKELVARAIYQHSRRQEGPFLAINCAAIPETLLESELFGHERGAYTGADRRRIGKFEQAHRGTIFLDEIGDMSLTLQAKILRLLEDGQIQRVGDNRSIQTDVRVIAATNQNLELRESEGQFRRDLLFRLNGFTIRLPSLRDRLEDLPPLVEYFIARFRHEFTKPTVTCTDATMAALARHTWPGNVRELQSAIRYAIVHSQGESILPDALPESCLVGTSRQANIDTSPAAGNPDLTCLVRELLASGQADVYRRALAVVDRIVLREALDYVRGNQVQASQLLGMSRTTLRSKLAQQGVPWDEFRAT